MAKAGPTTALHATESVPAGTEPGINGNRGIRGYPPAPDPWVTANGSLVTRLEFVRSSSPRGAAQADPHPNWLSPPLWCPVDSTRTCATDVPQAPAPKGPGRELGCLTCADVSGAGPTRSHDRRIQVPDVPQMCHKPLLRDDFGRRASDRKSLTCGNTSGAGRT